ncbi:MAG: hypothetical protein SOZ00_05745 [Tidjanibacter sp.]|nr:hypothetical protein [Tidjanibacter sp.]
MENNKDILRDDFRYFTDNHSEILEKYRDMFVVIKDKNILFAAPSFDEALNIATKNNLVVGTFLIQQCTEGDSAYTQTFLSRAIFS